MLGYGTGPCPLIKKEKRYNLLHVYDVLLKFAAGNKKRIVMARPIKDTPTLYGEDARRFLKLADNPGRETPEEMAKIDHAYEVMMSIFKN